MNKIYQKIIPAVKTPAKRKLNGFTLIELLVVVLIIGILSAVALPQYQTAVIKSKLSSLLPIMRSIKDAEEVYYLANGQYSNDMRLLDVQAPEGNSRSSPASGFYFYDNGTYIDAIGDVSQEAGWFIMGALRTDWSGNSCQLVMYLDHSPYPGEIHCTGGGTMLSKCQKVCRSLGYEWKEWKQ